MWLWLSIGWAGCAVLFVVLERIMARAGAGLLSPEDRVSSALVYGLFVLFAPVVIVIVLGMAVIAGPMRVWDLVMRKPIDPFLAPESEWLNQEPTLFNGDLARRRQTVDRRLKRENVGNWMMWQCDETPDSMILDVVTKYLALHTGGLANELIWERLEAHRFDRGEGILPVPCDLNQYVKYRLGLEDPGYLDLGAGFISEQIALCERYANHRAGKQEAENWPPLEWLEKKLSLVEFERLGDGVNPMEDGAPAVLSLGGDRISSELMDLKILMMPGDELWSFSSPPENWSNLGGRGGVVLVRDDRPIAYVITKKN